MLLAVNIVFIQRLVVMFQLSSSASLPNASVSLNTHFEHSVEHLTDIYRPVWTRVHGVID